jgi:hypothetical protein
LVVLPMLYGIWKKSKIQTVVFITVLIMLFMPWTIRNYRVYGKLIPTSANFSMQLFSGNYLGANGELDTSRQPKVKFPSNISPLEETETYRKTALKFIFANPLEYLKLNFLRTSIYFSLARPVGWWPYLAGAFRKFILLSSFAYMAIIFPLGFYGIWSGLRREEFRKKAIYLSLMAAAMPLPVIMIIVETRYRYPLYPFLAIFSGFSIWNLIQHRIKIKKLSLIILFFVLVTAFDVANNWERIMERIKNL